MPPASLPLLRPAKLTVPSFRVFARFVTDQTGIKMPDNKIAMLESRLQRRLRVLGLESLEQYQDFLFKSPNGAAELADFIDAVTTNKTDFFREPEHFGHLTTTVLPSLQPRGGAAWTAKVWCAGCSSGEEAYTLAMVLSEYGEARAGFDFRIVATDISTRVLQAAADAIYDASRIEPVPEELRKKYLLRSRDPARNLCRIVPALRGRVRFQRLNFMDTAYGLKDLFDVIFFRNVMIYFDKPTQQQVVQRLCRLLRPGGCLFISHSESLIGLDVPLQMVAPATYRHLAQ